jgi:hypothetical protein
MIENKASGFIVAVIVTYVIRIDKDVTLTPPQNPGMILGGVYEWLDTDVVPDTTYYYKLEDIDLKGVSTFHGPVSSIIVDAPAAVELRSVAAHGAILTLLPGLLPKTTTVFTGCRCLLSNAGDRGYGLDHLAQMLVNIAPPTKLPCICNETQMLGVGL